MNAQTQRQSIAGPGGAIECAIDGPAGAPRGLAVVCHPHPQHGGTMDNKVVQTLARAFVQLGYRAVRFNFRGVGASQGAWDEGPGEIDDALAVVARLARRRASRWCWPASPSAATSRRRPRRGWPPTAPPPSGWCWSARRRSSFDMAAVPADTLVIHGETDDVVPLAAMFDWARPQALPVIVVPGAGHFFHGQLPLLKSLVVGAWPR